MIPFWRWLPAGVAHDLGPLGVRLWAECCPVKNPKWRPFDWQGLHFANRLGLAGGVDKNADLLKQWPRLGFGFAEIGTVTPFPQEPNPGTIIGRDWDGQMLWNRMGFPSAGMNEVALQIQAAAPIEIPLFINIGKNRDTPVERAFEDYQIAAHRLAPLADALVVNISSPNTKGLRALQDKTHLRQLIESVTAVSFGKPVLVKFSPDEEASSLRESLETASEGGAKGFILTNTTLSRPQPSPFPDVGGVSGAFLAPLAKRALEIAVNHFKASPRPLIVSTGGILTPEEIKERLDLGADLVQIYSALVFHGPGFPGVVAKRLQ